MSDWHEIRISELATIDIGGTPSRVIPAFWADKPSGYPWISIADLKSKHVFETKEHITALGVQSSNVKLIPQQTTVMSFKLTVGRTAITGRDMFCNEAIAIFQPKDDRLNGRWLYHALPRAATSVVTDTAVKGATLNKAKMAEMKLLLPPPVEQNKVAQILDTLDTAIDETKAIIIKLKAVKQGLLHDLLTRGIDANGELRSPQAEAPHLYKESPLGWIPKEWEARKLAELLAPVDPAMRSGPFGSALLKQELVESGHPLLGIDNVHTERFVSDYTRFVTPNKFAQLARYAVHPGDLMITIMGTVGRCCLVPDDIEQALSSKHTWTITLDQEVYSPYLAMLQVNYSPWVLNHFSKGQQGGTMAAIRSETMKTTLLPTPPREEQRLMEDCLREIGKRIDHEVNSSMKMSAEKTGLMDDLLTGRIRVTPLLEGAKP
jgi:type I restriction enzyme S subunit